MRLSSEPVTTYFILRRERPDTIRNIVASLVGDGESGESLVDENDPIQPLQNAEVEDYSDPNWEPEPVDAGPGETKILMP
jgi:anaphase-promoting complex subunit 2